MDNISEELTGDMADETLQVFAKQAAAEAQEIHLVVDENAAEMTDAILEPEQFAEIARQLRQNAKSVTDRAQQIREAMAAQRDKATPTSQTTADKFEKRNPELKSKMLMALRESISPKDTRDDILRKVRNFYKDPALADEALEFLEEATSGDLKREVIAARAQLQEEQGREITAGRNIAEKAREYAQKGLGTPSGLRDMYRDITGNPRDSLTLFNELSNKFAYKDLKEVIKFLFHSLGADLKSSGPSIDRGLLHNLLADTRALQAIMGVYRFFLGRMNLMQKLFAQNNLSFPKQLTFELLAKQFMALVGERYPTPDKALDTTKRLGLEEWILAKIIALMQMRDAVREVALHQIYQNLQHRDDLLLAILEALEELEDELEEEDEKEEEEEEDEEGDESSKK